MLFAHRVLGVHIDKAQQCSAWSARPLTDAQVTYAANDARVLVHLADALVRSRQRAVTLGQLDALGGDARLLRALFPTRRDVAMQPEFAGGVAEARGEWEVWCRRLESLR
jgi:ribonuclease D